MPTWIIVLALLFGLGWILPLVVGITRVRNNEGGMGCVVAGSVWGFFGVSAIALVIAGYFLVGARVSHRARAMDVVFDPATYGGATGTLSFAYGGESELRLADKENTRTLIVRVRDGRAAVPVGQFTVQEYSLTGTGSKGSSWSAVSYTFKESDTHLVVTPNAVVACGFGPPYRASVATRRSSDGQRTFDFRVGDRQGNPVRLYAAGDRAKPPGFEVLNSDGEVVWHGRFAYG